MVRPKQHFGLRADRHCRVEQQPCLALAASVEEADCEWPNAISCQLLYN